MAYTSRKSSKEKDKIQIYKNALAKLKKEPPERLYLLYGEEAYLREHFLGLLREKCVEPDFAEFNHRVLDGASFDARKLEEAVNAMPFFSSHTLVEVRSTDFNKITDENAEALKKIISDIPDYCTLAFVVDFNYQLDGRRTAIKAVKKLAVDVEFVKQSDSDLAKWIERHFRAQGKEISRADIHHLLFISGHLMRGLLPEIQKIASYAKGDVVTRADIDAVAHHVPEANVFAMTDAIGSQDYGKAAALLQELLQMREEDPIKIVALLGKQMRDLYVARIALDEGLGKQYYMDTTATRYDFLASKHLNAAKNFSRSRLERAIRDCADCDFAMKSTGADDKALLCQLFAQLTMEEPA